MSLTDDLRAYALSRGIDLLGCTSASPFLVGEERREVAPRTFLPGAESIIIAACYAHGFETQEPSLPGAPRGRFGPGTRAALPAIRYSSEVVTGYLKQRGFQAVDGAEIPQKMAAARSGIACYGKNCLVHAAGLGSYLNLSAIITNARLECIDRPIETSDCGDCNACVAACPTGALAQPYHLVHKRCITSWFWGAPIPRSLRDKGGTHIFRCSYCQAACPKNQNLVPRPSLPFALEDKSDRPELIPLLREGEAYYWQTLPAFVMEAGFDTIRRNVVVAAGNAGDPATVPLLIELLGTGNAAVRAAAAWALGKLGGATMALEAALEREADEAVRREIAAALHDLRAP